MVNSLFRVTDYLSEKGHEVVVFSDIKHIGVRDSGVAWTNKDEDRDKEKYDVLVMNRGVGYGLPGIDAASRVLWTHDLPHAGFIPEPKVMKAFNKVVFMSKYAEQIWRTYYNCIGKSVFIPNGVVKSLFYPRKKDLDHIIFFSHPCRGLKRLPLIFEAVKTRLKRKDLYCTAYSNAKGMYAEGEMGDHGVEYDIEYKCGVDT